MAAEMAKRRLKVRLHPDIAAWVDRLAWMKDSRDPRRAKAEVVEQGLRALVSRTRKAYPPEWFRDMPRYPGPKRVTRPFSRS